jgi:hypothetical protein
MTLIPFTPRNPVEGAVTAFSRHATDCLHLAHLFAVADAGRADLAWLLDSQLHDLELAVRHLRRVCDEVRWDAKEIAA